MPGIDVPSLYLTLVDSNKVPYLTGQRDIINDAARLQNSLGLFMDGMNSKQIISHSWQLEDRIYLEKLARLKGYNPGRPNQFPNFQPGVNHKSHWAYYHAPYSWTAVELMQGAPKGGGAQATYAYLKDVRFQKDQDIYTSVLEDFDDLIWAQPNVDLMENVETADANAGGFPAMLSLPAWLNEEPNGLYTGYAETGNFTTIHGLSPVRYPNWVPTQVFYDNRDANFADPTDPNRLIEALVTAAHRINFRPPNMHAQYFEKATQVSKDFVCITGEAGRRRIDSAFAQNGDNFVTMGPTELAYGRRTVEGMVIYEHIPLDDYALYDSGSNTLTTQALADNPGPRFYMINKRYFKIMFFAERFFKRGKVQDVPGTDEAWAQDIKVWCQQWPSSRKRHAIVAPADFSV
jgi:hypothetical protein